MKKIVLKESLRFVKKELIMLPLREDTSEDKIKMHKVLNQEDVALDALLPYSPYSALSPFLPFFSVWVSLEELFHQEAPPQLEELL